MRAALSSAREGWDVWIALYDALLAGNAPSDPDIALAYVTPANALWNNGPQDVNAEIKRFLAEAQSKAKEQKSLELPEEAALPHQSSRAAIFTEAEGGVIGIAPPSPQDRLANTPEVRDFYEAVCEQAEYLAALGLNMLGQRLHQAVAKFQQCLSGSFEKAIERRVWSRGNALRVMLNEHDTTASDPTHPHRLEPSAAETLRGLVQLFNQLAFADPSLRSRDAHRPGPQEVDRANAGLGIAVEVIPVAAANRAITNSEAGAELSEQIDIAQQLGAVADDSLLSKLGREHAAETVGNFVSHAILRLRNAAVNVTKEVTSGFFRQAGATFSFPPSLLTSARRSRTGSSPAASSSLLSARHSSSTSRHSARRSSGFENTLSMTESMTAGVISVSVRIASWSKIVAAAPPHELPPIVCADRGNLPAPLPDCPVGSIKRGDRRRAAGVIDHLSQARRIAATIGSPLGGRLAAVTVRLGARYRSHLLKLSLSIYLP